MTKAFISLPTTDLERSKAFYIALGCEINPEMSDENGVCVVWGDGVYFMMISREFFATFTDKPIADPHRVVQTSVSFSRDSREAVDEVVARGLAAGGAEPRPAQDYGFMYSRDLDDPDGNSLGFLHIPDAAGQPDAGQAGAAEQEVPA